MEKDPSEEFAENSPRCLIRQHPANVLIEGGTSRLVVVIERELVGEVIVLVEAAHHLTLVRNVESSIAEVDSRSVGWLTHGLSTVDGSELFPELFPRRENSKLDGIATDSN